MKTELKGLTSFFRSKCSCLETLKKQTDTVKTVNHEGNSINQMLSLNRFNLQCIY